MELGLYLCEFEQEIRKASGRKTFGLRPTVDIGTQYVRPTLQQISNLSSIPKSAALTVESVNGGLFDTSPPEPMSEVIGSVVLQFEDCNSGSVIYDLSSIYQSGVILIKRVAIDNVPVCEAYAQSTR